MCGQADNEPRPSCTAAREFGAPISAERWSIHRPQADEAKAEDDTRLWEGNSAPTVQVCTTQPDDLERHLVRSIVNGDTVARLRRRYALWIVLSRPVGRLINRPSEGLNPILDLIV